jgi:hypothetical protein
MNQPSHDSNGLYNVKNSSHFIHLKTTNEEMKEETSEESSEELLNEFKIEWMKKMHETVIEITKQSGTLTPIIKQYGTLLESVMEKVIDSGTAEEK